MKAASFELARAQDLAQATALLARPGARVLAGGQSLGPMLNLRLAKPDLLVRIGGIASLSSVEETADSVTLGACVTHAAIADGLAPDPGSRVLARVAEGIAYRAVRNRGTIGGSLCHADPAADWLTVLTALDASAITSGGRRIPLPGFVTGAFRTALATGELLVAVRVPRLGADARWGYVKACRKPGEFAHAMAAVLRDGRRIRAVIGAVGGPPVVLTGDAVSPDGVRAALAEQLDPVAIDMQCVVLARALAEAGAWMVSLTVNGVAVREDVAPRTHLADFLRERLLLTGTHLGCEHGVCGACTVLIDGAPARSCIAFAAALDGARVDTIEGLEDDPVMARLRVAFSAEHALQCGYCTPGMLVTARDIVLRLPGADEARVRLELAGNLCRCTGYAGIARAILAVLRDPSAVVAPAQAALPAGHFDAGQEMAPPKAAGPGGAEMALTVRIAAPLAEVWRALQNPALIAECVPGARLTEVADGRIAGEMVASLGPIRARFVGTALVAYGPDFSGSVSGEGRDGGSRLSGEARFALRPDGAAATRLDLTISYALRGPLSQFGRGPIVRAFATEIAEAVAAALAARLAGQAAPKPAGIASLLWRALHRWLKWPRKG